MRRFREGTLAAALACMALLACGDDDQVADAAIPDDGSMDGRPTDAGGVIDASFDGAADASVDASAADASADVASDAADGGGDAVDGGGDAADGGFIERCEGSCAMTDLLATFGDASERLDVAYFGFNADATLYVEAFGGAAEGCPAMDSPSPDRTLVMGSVPVPTNDMPAATAATLLDFEGTLTSEPFVRASEATLIGRAAAIAPAESAFVRFDLDATFDGGRVSGAVYATHCDSLDAP